MECGDVRAALRARFDEGRPVAAGMEGHFARCPACRRYRERLAALDEALHRLPLEAPAPGFAARVQARVRGESARRLGVMALTGALTVAVAAVGVGWFYPLPLGELLNAFPGGLLNGGVDLARELAAAPVEQAAAVWASARQELGQVGTLLSPVALWTAIAGFLGLLILFNGFEARRAHTPSAGDRSVPRYRGT